MSQAQLQLGSEGPEVSRLRELLRGQGAALDPGDQFDAATEQAVINFQKAHVDFERRPLEPDGVVGPRTWGALLGPVQDQAGLMGHAVALVALKEAIRGVHEVGGNNRGADVEIYQAVTGAMRQPWCASFVSWCYQQVGIPLKTSHGFAGVAAMKQWAQKMGYWRPQTRRGVSPYVPPTGSIVIFGPFSHTGIVLMGGEREDWTVEGNTSSGNHGSQRDGDGVFRRTRSHQIIAGYVVVPEIIQ